MRKPTAILMGAGSRGSDTYGAYALRSAKLDIVALAEPDEVKRNRLAEQLKIDEKMRFKDWKELLAVGKIADGAIIATMDDLHVEPSIEAMKLGYDVLLEKPMDRTLEGAVKIVHASEKYDKRVMVAHVLRYTPFFRKIREIIQSGVIGDLIGIEHKENVGYWHMAHSFVRGNWRKTDETAPMILTKSCHDMDILYWLVGKKCSYLSSFGTLTHFRKENMPSGAAERCLDCKVEKDCPYSALKIYLNDKTGWPQNVISTDLSREGRLKALREGPYGRCVYACDNDVVDHQVVSMMFEDGITVNFTMQAFTSEIDRRIRVFGTRGEIQGHFGKNEIKVVLFGREIENIKSEYVNDNFGHGGGDYYLLDDFVQMLSDPNYRDVSTSAADSLESHLMAWAAEDSRLNNKTVDMNAYRKNFL